MSAGLERENQILRDGLLALKLLDEHPVGVPALDAAVCRECSRGVVGILRGDREPRRCDAAAVWVGQIRAAYRLAGVLPDHHDKVYRSDGTKSGGG